MQTIEPPIAGKTYVSEIEPVMRFYVDRIRCNYACEDGRERYTVKVCEDHHKRGGGVEISDEEWTLMMAEHRLIQEA